MSTPPPAGPQKLTDFNLDDFFTDAKTPWKASTVERNRGKLKRLKQILSSENYQELPAST
jgi:hypothetical protein